MSELQLIQTTVQRAGRRRRLLRAWQAFWRGFLLGGVLWLLALGAYKLLPLPVTTLLYAGFAAAACALIGLIVGAWRATTALQDARWVDDRQQLRERLSTALELAQTDRRGADWQQLVLADAARHASTVDVPRLLPFRLPHVARWTLLVLALGAGLGFVPEYRSQAYLQAQRDKDVIRETGRQLADLTRRSLERRTPAREATRETLKNVAELGDQLMRNPLQRSEALRELGKAADQVQQQTRDLIHNPAARQIEKSNPSGSRGDPSTAEELRKKMEELQKAMGNKEAKADAMDQLREQLQKSMQAAASMPNKDAANFQEQKDSLSQALSSLSQQAQELGQPLPSLEEALAALDKGQIDQVLKDLQVAEKDLAKMAEMARALEKMQQQMQQMGKDLAEQLAQGQAEAAYATLKKMERQLQSAGLTPEQLEKLLAEVSKAIGPASPYGEVAKYLREGAQQMQGKNATGAAQSLAKAADELAKLMQDLADAQDLAATLDALKRAQMCVGNGNCWGTNPGSGPPRAGKGKKFGPGVGTWAEESGWSDIPEQQNGYDNSTVQRPDTDARGLSDRGEGELSDALQPTRVKGQMNPGGPMPSITLKGVSIKGTSKVAWQEAVTTAQSEAQSALSQDRVPRAYQGTVKEYFDDLKK